MIKKRRSYRILVLLMSMFVLSFYGNAQKGYEEGFVVLNSKDTLYGSIKDRKEHPFGKLYKKIRFKGKRTTKYKPSQILAYKKGGSTFESKWISSSGGFLNQNCTIILGVGEPRFLKVVQKGFLSYYYLEHEDEDSGYIESVGYFKKEDDPSLIRVSQGVFGLRRKNLTQFLDDCPDLAVEIKNKITKNPREIVTRYNNCKRKN